MVGYSRLYMLANMHTYDAATGIFNNYYTLKMDWVTRNVERSNIRTWLA